MLVALCVLLSACEDKNSQSTGTTEGSGAASSDREYIFYSEITNEDWETIDFINKNSDYYFTLMEKMDENKCTQFMDVGNLYGEESEGGEVDSQGKKISSEAAIFRYMVILRNPSDYHILGIHQGDTYKEAKDIIEAAGFVWSSESEMYGDRTDTIYSKGNIKIRVVTFNTEEDGMDSDKIDTISVVVPIEDDSYEPVDGDL
jgi:hypothetical protein